MVVVSVGVAWSVCGGEVWLTSHSPHMCDFASSFTSRLGPSTPPHARRRRMKAPSKQEKQTDKHCLNLPALPEPVSGFILRIVSRH